MHCVDEIGCVPGVAAFDRCSSVEKRVSSCRPILQVGGVEPRYVARAVAAARTWWPVKAAVATADLAQLA